MNIKSLLSNRRMIVSLAIVVIVAAGIIGGTIAYFQDVEVSQGNVFQAGKFNLKIDNTCHYNGRECVCPPSVPGGPPCYWDGVAQTGNECYCTWDLDDLKGWQIFFNFRDIKPGDNGEDTISLHVYNNPAWICAEVIDLVNADAGCEEPECEAEGGVYNGSSCVGKETECADPGPGQGELQDNLFFSVWKDSGVAQGHACNNVKDNDETYLIQDQPAQAGFWPIADSQHGPAVPEDTTICYSVNWNVPLMATTDIIQSDSLTGTVKFTAVQSRHMDNFVCSPSGPCAPTTENCADGVDNDCDGDVDCADSDCNSQACNDSIWCNGTDTCSAGSCSIHAGNPCPGQDVGPLCNDSCHETNDNCTANDSNGTTCSGGSCQSGACVAACVPTTEVCDGVDNDCNPGTVDGSQDPLIGMACDGADSDLCIEGSYSCSLGVLICGDFTGDTTEVCGDGVDNDCDGQTDEGCVTAECSTSAECNDANDCTTDTCLIGTCIHNGTTGGGCFNAGCNLMLGTCSAGTCVCSLPDLCPGGCDDGDLCTTDACTLTGCTHTATTSTLNCGSDAYGYCNPADGTTFCMCYIGTYPNCGIHF